MFELRKYDQEATCQELTLDEGLFHRALEGGEKGYHVRNPKGEDFDIYYLDNNDDLEPIERYPAYLKGPYIAKYRVYDETDKETLYLEFLEGLRYLELEELNEYTIALARVALSFTDMEVHCADPRIWWFVPEDPRLHVQDELPQLPPEETLYVQKRFETGLTERGFGCLSSVYAFHNVFFFQWLLDGRELSQFKYATVDRGESGGIGSILAYNKRYERAFDYLGLKLISREDRIGRFRTSMLDKYFALGLVVDDATDENTLEVKDHLIFVKTKCVYATKGATDVSILAPKFREEMDEYYDALFAGEKMLGILIRGTDYISTGLSGERLMATVPQMLPTIRQWIEEDGYDRIFLATEDKEILQQMRDEFGDKVVVVAQERHSVSDLKSGQIISELEKESLSPEEYDARVEDKTINYFYALYLLSRCDSFMCSGQCNGWDVVNDFNGGKFQRSYKFSVGTE